MALYYNAGSSGPESPLATIRSFIGQAIQIGAPSYNAGDHRGCYEVYACTARFLVHSIEGGDEYKQVLRQALQRAALIADVTEQAWVMRHAFDSLLGKDNN